MPNLLNQHPEFREALYTRISNGDTISALQLSIEAGHTECALMKKQMELAQTQFDGLRIGFGEYAMVQNRMNYFILSGFNTEIQAQGGSFMSRLDALMASREGQPFGPVPYSRVRACIDRGETAEAIDLCRNLGFEYVHLKARCYNLSKYYNLGLVSDAVCELTKAQIHQSILTLILEAQDGEIDD